MASSPSSPSFSTTRIRLVLSKNGNDDKVKSSYVVTGGAGAGAGAGAGDRDDARRLRLPPTTTGNHHKDQHTTTRAARTANVSPTLCKKHNTMSSSTLPPLLPHVASQLQDPGGMQLPIHQECTSLKLTPSGRFCVAGFTDGTLRLFDLTTTTTPTTTTTTTPLPPVIGTAVCGQIQARGVHTSLQLHVDVSEDGRFAFGGVTRGSMELLAVDLTRLEQRTISSSSPALLQPQPQQCLLDRVHVYRHSEAKLKGFGACARLRGSKSSKDAPPKYLLLTGRGIKNLHIWCFTPPPSSLSSQGDTYDPGTLWQCLYDTPTNGNTISLLQLRYDPNGCLQAMSKSDDHKLRVWDLSYEQQQQGSPARHHHDCDDADGSNNNTNNNNKSRSVIGEFRQLVLPKTRPKRPPYVDVASTESTLGVAGAFAFGGGQGMYNQMSVVGLDVDNVRSLFNRTELALPGNTQHRRQQRGDLKSIVRVAGMVMDAGHVLLELSDGSIVQYSQNSTNSVSLPRLQVLPSDTFGTDYKPDDPLSSRTLCVTRVASSGTVVAAAATYRNGHGSIVLRQLEQHGGGTNGYWGFDGASAVPARKPVASKSPAVADKHALASCVQPTPRKVKVPEAEASRVMKLFPGGSLVTPNVLPVVDHAAIVSTVAKSNEAVYLGGSGSATRVSLSPSNKSALGPEVSPEQGATTSEMKRKNDKATKKKNSAMLKYLRKAGKVKGKKKKLKEVTMRPPNGLNEGINNEKSLKKRKLASPPVPRKRPAAEEVLSVKNGTPMPRDPRVLDTAESMCALQRSSHHSPMRLTRAMRKETDEDASAIHSAHFGRSRPAPLASHVPTLTVQERLATPTVDIEQQNVSVELEAARMTLAAHHRAQHEMLRKKVLRTADETIRALTRLPSISDLQAKKSLQDTLDGYKEILSDMLSRQQMEASSLAAQQSCWGEGAAPELQVSFPFPEVFHVAKACLDTFIDSA